MCDDSHGVVRPAESHQDFSGQLALVLGRHLDTSMTGGTTLKLATPRFRAAAPRISSRFLCSSARYFLICSSVATSCSRSTMPFAARKYGARVTIPSRCSLASLLRTDTIYTAPDVLSHLVLSRGSRRGPSLGCKLCL